MGTAAMIAPSWPVTPVSCVITGTRRGANQVLTSRSTQMNVMASPTPTKTRATSAQAYVSANANPACASVRVMAPVRSMRRGPNRSSSRPTGICMPA